MRQNRSCVLNCSKIQLISFPRCSRIALQLSLGDCCSIFTRKSQNFSDTSSFKVPIILTPTPEKIEYDKWQFQWNPRSASSLRCFQAEMEFGKLVFVEGGICWSSPAARDISTASHRLQN